MAPSLRGVKVRPVQLSSKSDIWNRECSKGILKPCGVTLNTAFLNLTASEKPLVYMRRTTDVNLNMYGGNGGWFWFYLRYNIVIFQETLGEIYKNFRGIDLYGLDCNVASRNIKCNVW